MDVYGKITRPYWDDKPVAVVGGGPSLIDFDLERLRGAHVLAVKGSIFDMPWADAGIGIDFPRYEEWRDKLADMPSRVYWAVPPEYLPRAGKPGKNVTLLKRLDGENVSADPGEIYGGGTSGFAALQICMHKRAKKIILFGFDYNGDYDATNGFRHNDKHYEKRRSQSRYNWEIWANYFQIYIPHFRERGIAVWNACPTSAIRCFHKVTLDDGVAMLREV